MILLPIAAAVIVAQARVPVEGPAPMSQDVARVRLAKLGYANVQSLKRNGDYWEATVVKNGAPLVLRFHVLSGARLEGPVRVLVPVKQPVKPA